MTEISMFFDPRQDEYGNYDREYNAQEFTTYFKVLVTSGVIKNAEGGLKVDTNGTNMITTVDTGIGFVEGKYYQNLAPKNLTHDTESLGLNRIDRVVLRKDLNVERRDVRAEVKKGVPSANPTPPQLEQSEIVWEIPLAQVKIVGGQTYINPEDVIDEREWAKSKILPDTTTALENHINDPLPHSFVDENGVKHNYGWVVESGILKFQYKEAEEQ